MRKCIFYNFAMLIVAGYLPPYAGIKRESGENPEQSRCCKLIIRMTTFVATAIFFTEKVSHIAGRRGHGAKSEDLQSAFIAATIAMYS